MAKWGSGTQVDPYKITDWENFVSTCNNPMSASTDNYVYITLPTVDQQGDPIPPERRVMDLRSHDWYRNTTIISLSKCFIWVEGNGWTILGLSMRSSTFFECKRTSPSSNYQRSYNMNSVFRNLIFKNVYLQGPSSFFKVNTAGGRIKEVSGCKFSGVIDTSTMSDPHLNNNFAFIHNNGNTFGYNIFTACSFNFKIVAYARLSMEYYGTLNDYTGTEFNNCLFNFSGKISAYQTSKATTSGAEYPPAFVFRARFFFCKFTGDIVFDDNNLNSSQYYSLLWDDCGTLNVFDFDVSSYPRHAFKYSGYMQFGCRATTQINILYTQMTNTSGFNKTYIANQSCFKVPSNRTQMTDETWLTNNGFVIGSPPTD